LRIEWLLGVANENHSNPAILQFLTRFYRRYFLFLFDFSQKHSWLGNQYARLRLGRQWEKHRRMIHPWEIGIILSEALASLFPPWWPLSFRDGYISRTSASKFSNIGLLHHSLKQYRFSWMTSDLHDSKISSCIKEQ